jgi:hypothetical protein
MPRTPFNRNARSARVKRVRTAINNHNQAAEILQRCHLHNQAVIAERKVHEVIVKPIETESRSVTAIDHPCLYQAPFLTREEAHNRMVILEPRVDLPLLKIY